MSFDTSQVSAALAARGLRLTRQRRAVLDAIAAAPSSVSPLQVFDAARERCPELGLTTVYRTLEVLSEIGALRRVHGPDHCESFVPAGAAHGHTVVCSGCGRVTEFTDCDMRGIADAAAGETGYRITDHFLQLSGLCAGCAAAGDARRAVSRGPAYAAPRCSLLLAAGGRGAAGAAGCGAGGRGRPQTAARSRWSPRPTFLADIAQNVAGDRFTVESLVPRGADPHAFEPTPRDLATVAGADLFIVNGGGLEETLLRTPCDAARTPTSWTRPGASRAASPSPASRCQLEEGEDRPPLLARPDLVVTYVENIRDAFIAADPGGEAAVHGQRRRLHRGAGGAGRLDRRAGRPSCPRATACWS